MKIDWRALLLAPVFIPTLYCLAFRDVGLGRRLAHGFSDHLCRRLRRVLRRHAGAPAAGPASRRTDLRWTCPASACSVPRSAVSPTCHSAGSCTVPAARFRPPTATFHRPDPGCNSRTR